MKIYEVELSFKDEPNVTEKRFIGEIEPHEDIEDVEKLPTDNMIFYYICEPDEMEYLKNPENNEDFVVIKFASVE